MGRLTSIRSRGLYKKMFDRGSGVASRLILGVILMCLLALPGIPISNAAVAEDTLTVTPSQELDGDLSASSVNLGTLPDNKYVENAWGTVDWLVFDYFSNEFHSWSDAEKSPPSDGEGWDEITPGANDDKKCWAAAASNVLEWTGWGYVIDNGLKYTNSDDMFQEFIAHWTDYGGWAYGAWEWWIDGTVDSDMKAKILFDGGGNFWPSYDPDGWIFVDKLSDGGNMAQALQKYLNLGYGVTLSIRKESDEESGHAITCWGFRYDPLWDPISNPEQYYKGIWITDSDDDKDDPSPPDRLQYFDLIYDGWWHLHSYPLYSGSDDYYIDRVDALQTFPNTPPTAVIGGPYSGDEGSDIAFNANGSWDLNGNPLLYRFDYENDGIWDTDWQSYAWGHHTYRDQGTYYAKLAVSDRMAVSYSTVAVTVNNVAPTIMDYFEPLAVNEGSEVIITAYATDPGIDDLIFTLEIAGQVWIEEFPYYSDYGSATCSFPYTPGDNGIYAVDLTISDEDGGENHYSTTLFVDDTEPIISEYLPLTVDEGSTVTINEDAWDFGSDDLEFTWYFELAPTVVHTYYNNGLSPDPPDSPDGDFPFHAEDSIVQPYGDNDRYNFILMVTDDEGVHDTYMTYITIMNVAPTILSCSMNQPNSNFILPIVHTLTFSAAATDPGSDDLYFFWDWGDGTPDAEHPYYNNGVSPDADHSPEKNAMNAADTANHTYAVPGDYTVTLIVCDDDGSIATTTIPVHVADASEVSQIIIQYIQSLPETAFKPIADARKTAFNGLFQGVDKTLTAMQYKSAILTLKNIRTKTDGYVGGSKKDDWIVQEASQREICHMIDDLIAYLNYLI